MNARIIAFVLSRLFALYLGVNHALGLFIGIAAAPFLPDRDPVAIIVSGVSFALYLLIAACLWFGAGWLADRVAGKTAIDLPEDMAFSKWQALVVMALGWLALLPVIRMVGNFAQSLLPGEGYGRSDAPGDLIIVMAAVHLIAAAILITRSSEIVAWLNSLRSWAEEPLVDDNEDDA